MGEIIRIKKGLDIPLSGESDITLRRTITPGTVGIIPADYPGYTWKLMVKPGDKVGCGSPIMQAREREEIKLVSPASGEITEIRRGERRRILAVVTDCCKKGLDPVTHHVGENADDIINTLSQSGLWVMMRQRPYDIVPDPRIRPRDIFITAFDSAPLAPALIGSDDTDALQAGITMLSKLTDGKVYLGVPFGSGISVTGAIINEFEGKHPVGNVGTQIAAVKPVNKGETIWALDATTVVRMGRLKLEGTFDASVATAVTGPRVQHPGIALTTIGCDLKSIFSQFEIHDPQSARIISGNVLTGHPESIDEGFLRKPWTQITVIADGSQTGEFMGWASINPNKFSVKRSFPAFFKGKKGTFDFDARLRGGRRAPILSGEYDKVFPMDIYPEFLLRAILDSDIDKMEKLGIYEVAPEDFALAEFVDTSKIPLQQIVRQGLDSLRKEME